MALDGRKLSVSAIVCRSVRQPEALASAVGARLTSNLFISRKFLHCIARKPRANPGENGSLLWFLSSFSASPPFHHRFLNIHSSRTPVDWPMTIQHDIQPRTGETCGLGFRLGHWSLCLYSIRVPQLATFLWQPPSLWGCPLASRLLKFR